MTLPFLNAATAVALPAESPMAAVAERHGAQLAIRDGWVVPVAFVQEPEELRAATDAVAFTDASPLTKTELQGPPELIAACAGGLAFATATRHEDAWWCRLSSTRALVLGAAPASAAIAGIDAIDVTSQFCGLRIHGPLCRQLMARFCALDLRPAVAPPGALRPGSVARTPGIVIVERPSQLLVLVGAALAEYLWTVVSDAAARLGGRAVGVEILSAGPLMAEKVVAGA